MRKMQSILLNKQWFDKHQTLLRWMANTEYGRGLIGISPKAPEKILLVAPSSTTGFLDYRDGQIKKMSNYLSGNLYSQNIAKRWNEFQEYAAYFRAYGYIRVPTQALAIPLFATTSTYQPQSGGGGGNTSMDGRAKRQLGDESWATIRAGASSANDNNATSAGNFVDYDVTGFDSLMRGACTYYTADGSIGTDTISQVFDSHYIVTNDTSLYAVALTFGAVTLAARNDFGTGDFAIANWGTTRYCADLSGPSLNVYNDSANFNATGIAAVSTTVATVIGHMNDKDFDNVSPPTTLTTSAQIVWRTADFGDAAKTPTLTVVHAAAATGTAAKKLLLGVGL